MSTQERGAHSSIILVGVHTEESTGPTISRPQTRHHQEDQEEGVTVLTIKVLFVYSTIILSRPRAERLVRDATAIIECDTGVKVEPVFRADKTLTRLDYTRTPLMLYDHQKMLKKYAHGNYRKHILLIAPAARHPIFQFTRITGEALVCGPWGIVGYARTAHHAVSAIAVAHELGHMLGAQHSIKAGVMFSAAPQFAAQYGRLDLGFTKDSVDEIWNCQTAQES
jgi:hypothetical protein